MPPSAAARPLHNLPPPSSAAVIYALIRSSLVPYWRKILQRMAWQPSRVVPGLTQYLAAKGLAFAPTQTTCCVPNSMQADAAQPEDKPERVIPSTVPPAKRVKVDTPSPSIIPKSLQISSAHSDVPVPASIDDLPPLLRESLLPFQKEGITFAINRGGRVLIGDDMGLGSKSPLTFPTLFPSPSFPPPLQRRFKPCPCVGCCGIIGQHSSSCPPACALPGLKS